MFATGNLEHLEHHNNNEDHDDYEGWLYPDGEPSPGHPGGQRFVFARQHDSDTATGNHYDTATHVELYHHRNNDDHGNRDNNDDGSDDNHNTHTAACVFGAAVWPVTA